uniref:Uncharacterized protein n=1 Tax=Arundo donax TaxID=35708 RepID=A0A0A9C5Y0_ARUDO
MHEASRYGDKYFNQLDVFMEATKRNALNNKTKEIHCPLSMHRVQEP